MGSEGYLINQFIVTRTNKRTDKWGKRAWGIEQAKAAPTQKPMTHFTIRFPSPYPPIP
jgi:hypothetical protein